jgi:RNA 3'-terminal phosphate cyclase (ATP)
MTGLSAPIVLDGAHMEGGGALIRTALTMSALTQQPVRIANVRAHSPTPGLNTEDVTVLRAVGLACGAEIKGEFGEHELTFSPTRSAVGLNERIEPVEGTDDAHANSLVVLHSLLPVMARSGVYSKLTAYGENFGHGVLSYDYFVNVTLAAHRRFGLYAYPELSLAGFGKGSRGEVRLEIEPSSLHGVDWPVRGELISCSAVVATAELSKEVSARGASHLTLLARNAKLPLQVESFDVRSRKAGAFVTVFAEFEQGFGGATAMGRRGVRMEQIAQTAFNNFMDWFKGTWTLDSFVADQLLVTAAMSETETTFTVQKITERFLTTVWVIKQFLPIRITVRGQEGEPGVVTVRR